MPQTEAPAGAPAEATIEWIRDFEERFLEAWNSHQADRVLAMMTEDIEYRDDAWPKTMRGHADVREFLEAVWTGMPDLTFEMISGPYVIPGEPRGATYWRGSATHTGRLDPPGFAATGRRWEGDGGAFSEYRDGRVARLRICLDMLDASRQLGLMPPVGSRAERTLAATQRVTMKVRQAISARSRR